MIEAGLNSWFPPAEGGAVTLVLTACVCTRVEGQGESATCKLKWGLRTLDFNPDAAGPLKVIFG